MFIFFYKTLKLNTSPEYQSHLAQLKFLTYLKAYVNETLVVGGYVYIMKKLYLIVPDGKLNIHEPHVLTWLHENDNLVLKWQIMGWNKNILWFSSNLVYKKSLGSPWHFGQYWKSAM